MTRSTGACGGGTFWARHLEDSRLKTQDPRGWRTRLVTYGALGRRASRDDGPASADCFRTAFVTLLRDMRRRLDGRGLFPSRFSLRCYADCVSFHDTGSKSLAAQVLILLPFGPARTGRLSPARARAGSTGRFCFQYPTPQRPNTTLTTRPMQDSSKTTSQLRKTPENS